MSQMYTEPHSAKQIEDCVGWGLETTPEVLIATDAAPSVVSKENVEDFVRRVRCPVLIFHGDEDALVPYTRSTRLAELTGGKLVTIEGGGHYPHGRDPVKFNLLLRDFIKPSPPPPATCRRARNRPKRALYISSPIGLCHAHPTVPI